MFALDLGELAYGSGEAVELSKEVLPAGPEGDAAALPICCAPEACSKIIRLDTDIERARQHRGSRISVRT